MNLAELSDHLLPVFKLSRQKDVKTAIGYLAKALDCPDPQHCSPELYNQSLVTLYRHIEDYFIAQGKSSHTIRNTKNVISRLFRLADQQHLVSLVPVSLTPQYDSKHRPNRPGSTHRQPHATYLPYAQWPSTLQSTFLAFKTWATAPVVPGRPAHLRKRLTTMEVYQQLFEGYFGYLSHTKNLIPTFDALFDYDLVNAYVYWHVNDCHQKPTISIRVFLQQLIALTRQYRPLPELRAQLVTLARSIPLPPPTYDKADAWVSLAKLEEIARLIWPRKKPTDFRTAKGKIPGLTNAVRAGISLMLRLWTYIPYRQRNIREMQLKENLRKDNGTWHIIFRGEQLKVARKRGRSNVFDLPFPPKLVPLLEDYLATWRPLLLAKVGHPDDHVFLTRFGTPYKENSLHSTTRHIVYRYTQQYWHPHIIRTVWATEMIRNGLNLLDVAKMLNDKFETVVANYSHLLDEDVAEKVYELIDKPKGQDK